MLIIITITIVAIINVIKVSFLTIVIKTMIIISIAKLI